MVDGSLHGDAVTAKPRATAQLPISFNWKPCACAPHTAPQATSITSVGARNTFMGASSIVVVTRASGGAGAHNSTRLGRPGKGAVGQRGASATRSGPHAERVHRVPRGPREQTGERRVAAVARRAALGVDELRGDAIVERRAPQPLQDRGCVRA